MRKPGAHQAKKKKTQHKLSLTFLVAGVTPLLGIVREGGFKIASKVLKWLNKVIKSIQEH